MQEKQSRSSVSRSYKKNEGQDVNQIPGTQSCSERVAQTHPHILVALYKFLSEFEMYETNAPEFSRIFSKFSKAKIHSPLVSQYELSR